MTWCSSVHLCRLQCRIRITTSRENKPLHCTRTTHSLDKLIRCNTKHTHNLSLTEWPTNQHEVFRYTVASEMGTGAPSGLIPARPPVWLWASRYVSIVAACNPTTCSWTNDTRGSMTIKSGGRFLPSRNILIYWMYIEASNEKQNGKTGGHLFK